jgi:hypothetical protein
VTDVDPLTAVCPHCNDAAGFRCTTRAGTLARKPHVRRVRLATALAAHADPALDAHFPRHGPCGLCGVPGLGARHRVIDAIAGRLEGGEGPEDVAADYGLPPEAIDVITKWMRKWPSAW